MYDDSINLITEEESLGIAQNEEKNKGSEF
jgi:hypothetical protein